jgi:hypothetical protein
MIEGKALLNTMVGTPDFVGDREVVTLNYGGAGKLIKVLKCPKCGYSVSKGGSK